MRWVHDFNQAMEFVKNRVEMWTMYNQCKELNQIPSEVVGIRDSAYLAWQFNNAVFYWGRHVDARMNERDKKGRPKNRIEDVLGIPRKVKPINVGSMLANRKKAAYRFVPSKEKALLE